MKRFGSVAGIIATVMLLTGCEDRTDGQRPSRHGRYLGIGTYAAGELWAKMAQRDMPRDPATATTADDEHVIVVVDSQTGEIRECGDYSGHCISMNPWTKAIAPEQAAPVKLTKHAADLAAEADEAGASKADAAPRP